MTLLLKLNTDTILVKYLISKYRLRCQRWHAYNTQHNIILVILNALHLRYIIVCGYCKKMKRVKFIWKRPRSGSGAGHVAARTATVCGYCCCVLQPALYCYRYFRCGEWVLGNGNEHGVTRETVYIRIRGLILGRVTGTIICAQYYSLQRRGEGGWWWRGAEDTWAYNVMCWRDVDRSSARFVRYHFSPAEPSVSERFQRFSIPSCRYII